MSLDRTLVIFVRDRNGFDVDGATIRFFVNGAFIGEAVSARGRGSLQTRNADAEVKVTVEYEDILREATLAAEQNTYEFTLDLVTTRSTLQIYLPLIVGLVLLGTAVTLAFIYDDAGDLQRRLILTLASLGSGGVASAIPGFLNVHLTIGKQLVIAAAGAMAVFVLIYFVRPAGSEPLPHDPPAEEREHIDQEAGAR